METVTIPKERLNKILTDVEVLVEDVAHLLDQDMLAKQRRADLEKNPSLGRSEKELDIYLKKRGVHVE